MIPGSHRFGLLTKEAIRSLTNGTAGTDCIVPKGGALAMFPLIVHASSKSQTDVSRPVLHIEYNDPAVLGKGIQLAVA